MVNLLRQLENPQINHELFFEVFRDFRKGGLNPQNFDEFIALTLQLPAIAIRTEKDYDIFNHLNLIDITQEESPVITREVMRRAIEKSKKCWHPEADPSTCKIAANGRIIVSAAHSIQNNGVLSKIVENGHVMSYVYDKGEFDGKEIGKNVASIFWGFCNTHDAIFKPIEVITYTQTAEQNFLFAYRGFVISSHRKLEVSTWMNYGEQSENDITENTKIFNAAILAADYSIIETDVFELPAFYPIAVSSAFYLDFDFEGHEINHSEERMENIFFTLLPVENKTYFILSYFKQDRDLYGQLGDQLRKRANLKSDITMLIAAHTENVYFNPVYYDTFIKKYENDLAKIMFQTQFDHATIDKDNNVNVNFSFTPNDYLLNEFEINFFGY